MQPKKLEAQQRQHLHCALQSHVLKPKKLAVQQWQHIHSGLPGHVEQPGSMPVSKKKHDAQKAQNEEPQ